MQLGALLEGAFLVKPNEHEAKILTGVEVMNFESAQRAAHKLMHMGVESVLITAGVNGAYLFTSETEKHIPIPHIVGSGVKDETGCGDQTMATLCAYLQDGAPLARATETAILAGTLQFHKQGIQPITTAELAASLS